MKLYSMVLNTPQDHRKHSTWQYDRNWNITKVRQLNTIIRRLNDWTTRDSNGRVLCSGFPSRDMELQKRVYVVKLGHDGKLFTQFTPHYDTVKNKLSN